jgi:biotin carboxyl carrier protein
MQSEDIQSVIALMKRHGIAAFDYEHGSVQLHLTLGADVDGTATASPDPAGTSTPDTIRSPGVGIVLHTHPANAGPAPALPRKAAKGEVVAYVQTGLTLRCVLATRDCRLHRALAAEGTGVGYGDALFEVAPVIE